MPVCDTVREAVEATVADATVIYVPPPFAGEAIIAEHYGASVDRVAMARNFAASEHNRAVGIRGHRLTARGIDAGDPLDENVALRIELHISHGEYPSS